MPATGLQGRIPIVRESSVRATSVTGGSIAFQNNNGETSIVANSSLRAVGNGIWNTSGATLVKVENSQIEAAAPIRVDDGTALVGGSRLEGGANIGTVTCAGVWDENFVFYADTCP